MPSRYFHMQMTASPVDGAAAIGTREPAKLVQASLKLRRTHPSLQGAASAAIRHTTHVIGLCADFMIHIIGLRASIHQLNDANRIRLSLDKACLGMNPTRRPVRYILNRDSRSTSTEPPLMGPGGNPTKHKAPPENKSTQHQHTTQIHAARRSHSEGAPWWAPDPHEEMGKYLPIT